MRSFGRLYVQVLNGVAIGIALGYAERQIAISLKPLGDAFIKVIKLIVVPIVFTTIAVSVATVAYIPWAGAVGRTAIIRRTLLVDHSLRGNPDTGGMSRLIAPARPDCRGRLLPV